MKVYLDNGATTRLDPRVLAKMRPYLTEKYGNASAINYLGQAAYLDLMEAKKRVAKLLGGEPAGVIFTSGATEANNLIIKGVALAIKPKEEDYYFLNILVCASQQWS